MQVGIFPGKLAARVFHALRLKSKVEVIILYGGHLSTEDLPRVVTEEACETPFGDIEIHTGLCKESDEKNGCKKGESNQRRQYH